MTEDEPEPLLVTHRGGQRALGVGPSHYWGLVRAGKIQVVGKGKAGRAFWPSIKGYVNELVTEAQKAKAAATHAAGKAA